MTYWTGDTVITALEDVRREGAAAPSGFSAISTDSRSIEPGALFVALVGERFDGHDYLAQVAEKGAVGAVVSRIPEHAPDSLVYYVVSDTLVALGRLGRHRRRALSARVVAVTGSNGKTTTKEMLRAVLGTKYRVHATTGNLNNRIGTPLTLLAAPDDAEVLVVELGTSLPGEIALLGEIVEPDAAVVTAISEEHLEGLGDLHGVLEEEISILASIRDGGFAVVADEPAELPEAARSRFAHVHAAGWTERADAGLRASDVTLDVHGNVDFGWNGRRVHVPLRGRHNARNALIALGVATEWGIDADQAVAALRQLKPAKMRGETHDYGDLTVIADCYNSNPASLSSAIDLLASLPQKRHKVAVVGSMLELGSGSAALHQRSAREIAESNIDLIVATGEFVPAFAGLREELGDRLICAHDPVEAWEQMESRLVGDDLVLLKGSRGVALERLLPRLEEYGSAPPPRGGRKAGGVATAHHDAKTASVAEHSHE